MNPLILESDRSQSFQSQENPPSASIRFLESRLGSPEMQLLLECCRRALGTVTVQELGGRIIAPFDETVFFDHCREHRLTLMVYKVLIRPFRDQLSPGLVSGFDKSTLQIMRSQLQLCNSMIGIHRAFCRENLRHLFLKGPALNRLLFEEETLRHSKDLDILIEASHFSKADAQLRNLGFLPIGMDMREGTASSLFLLRRKDISYGKKGAGGTIELHWRTDSVETIVNPELFDWDAQTGLCRIQQESIPVLADHHHCMYLCLHAAKHDWSRLCWLLDIPLFMKKRDISRDSLLVLADKHGLRKPVLEAFFLSDRYLGSDFGYNDLDPSGKRSILLARRIQTKSVVRSRKLKTFLIIVQKGMLYPKLGKKAGFWYLWALNQGIIESRKGILRLRSWMAYFFPRRP